MSKKINLKQLISAAALMSVASIAAAGGPNPSISLTQTVGTDVTPLACGASSVAVVTLADSVNFCYTVTNDGDVPFDLHTLSSDVFGALSPVGGTLAPTESMQFNDIRTLSSDVFNTGTWDADNPPAVAVATATGGFDDISATGTLLAGGGADGGLGDDGEQATTIPFPFTYFGVTSTDLCIGNNGAAVFGTASCNVDWNNGNGIAAPTADEFGMIAPFWDDLGYNANVGNVYTETKGTAPNRHFIVQWHEQVYYALGATVEAENITFQLALYETTNEIQFRYSDVIFGGGNASHDGGASAEIGLVSPDGTTFELFSSQGGTVIADGDDISFTFVPGLSASASAVSAVNVLVPQVAPNANGTLTSSVVEGAMGSGTLDISNAGEGMLNWALNEASSSGVARTPRPISFYTPEYSGFTSHLADINLNEEKTSFSSKPEKIIFGTSAVAYGVDVRNDSFGTIDHTTPGAFNEILAAPGPYYGGDFIGQDYTKMYAVKDDNSLYTIDTATGAATLVAAVTGGAEVDGVSGMSEDITDGTVYISTTNTTTSHLYTLDIVTGVSTLVGEVTNSPLLIDIAVSLTGDIYGFDISNDSLIAIDKGTGAGTVVGAIGINANFAQGMDFDNSTNTLYLAAYIGGGVNEVRTIDVTTGASTLVGSVNPNPGSGGAEVDSFAIAADADSCYAPEDIPWLSLSVTSGATAAGGMDQVTVSFDATSLTAGGYSANVCLFSDDPDEPLVKVPVSLEVTLPDLIFMNGFE